MKLVIVDIIVEMGCVDVLVFNVGCYLSVNIENIDEVMFDVLFVFNVKGVYVVI